MTTAVSPHKPAGPTKPDACPTCGNPYEWRCRQRQDIFWVGGHFRHHSRGWVYVHADPQAPAGVFPR